MRQNLRERRLVHCALVFALVFLYGCGSSNDPAKSPPGRPQQPADPLAGKAYVEVLLGLEGYNNAAPQLAVGKKAKFKAQIATASTKGKIVKLHLGQLYTGDQKPVQAADLTKDFATDKAAAEKKYRREEFPRDEVIVEGLVLQLRPQRYTVILKGYEE